MPRSVLVPVLLITLICAVVLGDNPSFASAAARAPQQTELSGIDVSSIQHLNGASISWSAVAAAGYSFAYIKATEGTYYTNPYYSADLAGAAGSGVMAGAYSFANPSTASGAAEADYLLGNSGYVNNGQMLPPMLDVEADPYQAGDTCWGLSASAMVSWISAFVSEIRARTGQYTLIYTSAGWWQQCTGSSSAFSSDPLSIASYGGTTPTLPSGGWQNWTIWQWTSTGSVPGVTGATDLDAFNGDSAALSSFARGIAPAPDQTQYWVATNSTGALEVFLRGGDGQFWTDYQTQAGNNSSWSGWYGMGGSWPGEPTVVLDGQGRLELFARGGDGQLWHAYETQAGNPASWSGFSPLGGRSPRDPVAIVLPSGAVDVWEVGGDLSIWHDHETSSGSVSSWSGWNGLGGFTPGQPAPIVEPNGEVELFARGTDGSLWRTFETSPGNEQSWAGWYGLGGVTPGQPQPVIESDGRVDLFVRGTDGSLWHRYQTAAGNEQSWSGWYGLGGYTPLDPAVGRNSDGRLEVLVIGGDGELFHNYETAAANSNAWSGWYSLGGSWPSPPALGVAAGKALQVFVVGGNGALWFSYETVAGRSTSWSGFYSLGGNWPSP